MNRFFWGLIWSIITAWCSEMKFPVFSIRHFCLKQIVYMVSNNARFVFVYKMHDKEISDSCWWIQIRSFISINNMYEYEQKSLKLSEKYNYRYWINLLLAARRNRVFIGVLFYYISLCIRFHMKCGTYMCLISLKPPL